MTEMPTIIFVLVYALCMVIIFNHPSFKKLGDITTIWLVNFLGVFASIGIALSITLLTVCTFNY
jgi:hypothetical protein